MSSIGKFESRLYKLKNFVLSDDGKLSADIFCRDKSSSRMSLCDPKVHADKVFNLMLQHRYDRDEERITNSITNREVITAVVLTYIYGFRPHSHIRVNAKGDGVYSECCSYHNTEHILEFVNCSHEVNEYLNETIKHFKWRE